MSVHNVMAKTGNCNSEKSSACNFVFAVSGSDPFLCRRNIKSIFLIQIHSTLVSWSGLFLSKIKVFPDMFIIQLNTKVQLAHVFGFHVYRKLSVNNII